MQFRDTIEGATGYARSAAIATGNRVKSLTSQLTARLGPWMTVLAGLASAGFGIVRSAVAGAVERMKPLASRLAERVQPLTSRLAAYLRPLMSWLAERLQPWTALLKDVAAVVADATRTAYEAALERARPLVARVTDRFGVRMTVMGAATAIFVGSTGSTAWAITSMEGPAGTPAEQDAYTVTVAESIAGVSEDAAVTAEQLAAAQAEAAAAAEAEAEAAEAEAPAEPEPVGGLSELQMDNAIAIVEAGDERGLGEQAWAVALSTAMQESKFRNYANVNVPESYDYAYQAEGSDHDSVGLFQQRPSSGWGSVGELMDPKTSAHKFYNALENVDGWKDMPITVAAQTVQVSAFPDAYAPWEDLAWDIIESYKAAKA